MFDNIGEKLMGLAQFAFWATIIATGIWTIVVWVDGEFLTGLLIAVGGTLVSIESSWLLYAFGQLVDNVGEMATNQRKFMAKNEKQGSNAFKENKLTFDNLPKL